MTIADIMEEYSLLQAKRRQKIERLRQKNSQPPLSDLDERRRELLLMPMRAALFGEPFDPAANDLLLAETERQMEEAAVPTRMRPFPIGAGGAGTQAISRTAKCAAA